MRKTVGATVELSIAQALGAGAYTYGQCIRRFGTLALKEMVQ